MTLATFTSKVYTTSSTMERKISFELRKSEYFSVIEEIYEGFKLINFRGDIKREINVVFHTILMRRIAKRARRKTR